MLGTEQPVQAEQPEQEQFAPEPLGEALPEEALPEDPVPEEAITEEQLAKRRIRPRTPEDQQVIDLYRSEGFDGSFSDAARIIYGSDVTATAPSPVENTEDASQNYNQRADQRVSALQQEIAELETKVTEATDNLETGEALSLQREIMRKEIEAQAIKNHKLTYQRELKRAEEDAYRSKAVESRDKVYETFPELQDENSVPRRQFDDFVERAQNDPDYAVIFDSPKWPEIMAREFAGISGLGQQQQPQQQQQVQAPIPQQRPPVMGNQAKVLTTGTTAQPSNAPLTAQGVAEGLPNMSNEQLYQMLGNAPQPANLR